MSGGIISAISLLVGGIGIMNIMLASITERVREIGIRKAIGATFFDVFTQILVESVVIAIIGGLAGLLTSSMLVKLLVAMSPTENTPVITMQSMSLAFAFSVAVGVLARDVDGGIEPIDPLPPIRDAVMRGADAVARHEQVEPVFA
jgi:putative ABC transport system permease protein